MATYNTSVAIIEATPFTITPKNSAGDVAFMDANSLSFAVADPTVLSVGPWGDGVHYKINPLKAGVTIITLAATSNSVPFSETIEVTVTPVVATTFAVVFKAPIKK